MGKDGIPQNIKSVAQALVKFRESGGPNGKGFHFTTVFDLNEFFNSNANPVQQLSTPPQPTDVAAATKTDWDTSPASLGGLQAQGDFESRYLMLTRISNLVTTRSDSFTVFITVDGFRYKNTPQGPDRSDPQLVVHRRAAMIVDRSGMTAENGTSTTRVNVNTQ